MESLLKSEVISDDVRRLLLEIMFAGVNHSLISGTCDVTSANGYCSG